MVELVGLEPTNLCNAIAALSQLSYNPKLSALRRSASRGY